MSETPVCQVPRIGRHEQGRRLSLQLVRLTCLDETEHEGVVPFEGEGIANDAIRLTCAVTTRIGVEAEPLQCRTETMNLGDNYEDNRTVTLNREVAALFIPSTSSYPVTMNVVLLLGEEDWGGANWDKEVKEVVKVVGAASSKGVATLTATGVGGAIGSSLGPVGTAVGAAVGAIVGAVIDGLTSAIQSLESDAFPPQDLSLFLQSPDARFEGASPDRLIGHLDFAGHGGHYRLTYEWRFQRVNSLPTRSGMRHLVHWYNGDRGDNFLTSDPRWSGRVGDLVGGYRLFREEGQIFDPRGSRPPGTLPLYSWWNPERQDNFITSDPRWSMDPSTIRWSGENISNGRVQAGYSLYRLEGYIYDPKHPQPPGTLPLFSWWSSDRADNFATTNPRWSIPVGDVRWSGEHITNGIARDGYVLYRLEGYVQY
jgi:hypothetical protein